MFVCVSSPTSDGGAAAVICSEKFVHRYGLESQAVEIVAQEMRTDFSSTFDENSAIKAVCDCTIILCESILICICFFRLAMTLQNQPRMLFLRSQASYIVAGVCMVMEDLNRVHER